MRIILSYLLSVLRNTGKTQKTEKQHFKRKFPLERGPVPRLELCPKVTFSPKNTSFQTDLSLSNVFFLPNSPFWEHLHYFHFEHQGFLPFLNSGGCRSSALAPFCISCTLWCSYIKFFNVYEDLGAYRQLRIWKGRGYNILYPYCGHLKKPVFFILGFKLPQQRQSAFPIWRPPSLWCFIIAA